MTTAERTLLDIHISKFTSFSEFHQFLFANDIELTHDEWLVYRSRMFYIINSNSSEVLVVNTDMGNLILPKFYS
jgi:hypothetical protein